jgi:protein SCO1/2
MNFRKLLFTLFIINIRTIAAQDIRYGINDLHGSTIPLDIVLLNEDSITVTLKQIIDKPTLLAFVYYKCPGICNKILDGIAEVISKSKLNPGTDYQVITLSIDYAEKPSLARFKKNNYLKLIKNKNAQNGWKFFTADSVSISKLTKSAGFQFQKIDSTILHPSTLIVLSPKGKICRYLHGTYYLPMEMEMALADAKNEIDDASRIKAPKICHGNKPVKNITTNKFVIFWSVTFAIIIFGIVFWLLKIKYKKARK